MSIDYIIKNPVGYALIVINSFVNVGEALRSGWKSEVILSEKLFKALGFEVIILIDITRERCLEELTKITTDEKLGSHSMFLFAIFTHGEEKEVLLFPNSDKACNYNYEEYLASKIGPQAQTQANVPSNMETDQANSSKEMVTELSCLKIFELFYNNLPLKGKPKYFIINACRGEEYQLNTDDVTTTDRGDWIRLFSAIEGTKGIRALPPEYFQKEKPSLLLFTLYYLYEDCTNKKFDGRDINWSDLSSHIDRQAKKLICLDQGVSSSFQLDKSWSKGDIRILLQKDVYLPPLKDLLKCCSQSEVEGNQDVEKDSGSRIISGYKEIPLNTPANGNMGICYSVKFGIFFANREENSIYHIPTNTDKPYKVLDENSGIVGPIYVACTKINLFISHERGVSMLPINSLHEKPQSLPFLPPSGIICPAIDTTSECVYILDRYCNKNDFNSNSFFKRDIWSYKDHLDKPLVAKLDLPNSVSADKTDPFVISDMKVKFTIAFNHDRMRAYICILFRGITNEILIYLQKENGFSFYRNFRNFGSENMDPCFFVINDNLTTIFYTDFLTNAVKHHLLNGISTVKPKTMIRPTGIAINRSEDTACILCQNSENKCILFVLNNFTKLSV